MANSIASVSSLEGQAWAKEPDGTLRPLKVGDTVTANEIVITATGAHIELDFGDGHPVTIASAQEVLMSQDLWKDLASDNKDAAVDDASLQQALTVLNDGGDLTTSLDETAAGLSGGAANEGHSFVELTRIVENTNPNAFNYDLANGTGNNTFNSLASANPINHAPQVDPQDFSGDEDTAINGHVIVTDVENDALSYNLAGQPANGTIALNATTGDFVYTPKANYNGADSFVVTVTDDHGNATTQTINLTVIPVNDAPVSGNQNLTTLEDTPIAGQVIATDIENDTLNYSVATTATHGIVTLDSTTGAFIYVPGANYHGSDQFVVTVADGNGGVTTSTIFIGVTPVNDAPVSANQNITTPEDIPISGTVVASDVDGDTLIYTVSANALHGTVSLNSTTGDFVYQPNTHYNGSDQFLVTVSDGHGGITTSIVNVDVQPVFINVAPIAVADSIIVAEGGTATILVGGASSVLANDSDAENDTLHAILVSGPANGSLTLNNDGTFSYTHNGSETTGDSFTYKVNDGSVDGNTVTVNIGVTPVNDAPVAVADSIIVAEGGTATILVGGASSVLANDSDAENDTLHAILVSGPANGSLTLNNDGTFSYTHNGSETTGDSFTYKVNDGSVDGNTVTVNIGVTPVNDAPVAVADSIIVAEGGTATILVGGASSVLANDSDAENDTLHAILVSGPANGSLTLNNDGTFSYTHNGSETTGDSFTYKVNDGSVDGNTVTVNIGVTPVNDAPVAVADSIIVAEGGTATILVGGASSVLANDSDAENDTLHAILVSGPANGSLTLNNDGTFSYTHNGSETTGDSFTYKVNDGSVDGNTVTVNIGVTPVNDAPVAVADSIIVAEGGTATILVGGASSVLANDSDAENDTLHAILVSGPANGSLTLNNDGTFSYTHNGSETTGDSFTYKVNDGSVDGNTVTVNIGVTPVNDAPVAVADSIIVAEGGTATILVGGASSVLANDSDAENDTLHAILVSGPANGSLTLNNDGTFSYTHNGSETTGDSFTYKVNDGSVDGNTVTVNIGVTPVNDAPVAVADSIIVAEGGTATILVGGASSVLANDSDAENDTLHAILVSGPANGSLTLNNDGTFSYTHNGSETTGDSFTYKVNDGSVDGNTVTVNIGVTPVNDAPVAVADSIIVAEGGTATILVGGASSVLANDSDAENDTLHAILVSGPANGSLTLNNDGTFSYTHNGSETTGDSFTYKVNDGSVDGNTVTVNIGVTPVNDAPVAVADSIIVAEGGTATILVGGASSVLANDSDAENDTLHAILVSGPANGSLTLNNDGTFSYTHNGSETTGDSFTYKVNDGSVDGNTVTVNIGVTPVNDAPVAVADSIIVAEGGTATILVGGASSVLANDSDAENDTLHAILVSGPANGSLTLNNDGTFSYTHNGSETTGDSFTYKVNDGSVDGNTVTVNIGVTPVNDAPVAVADSIIVAEGGTATILVGGASSVLANDSDAENDTLHAILVSGPANGSLTLNNDGTFSYTHNGSETTGDSFTYKVNDGSVDGNTVTVNIGVTPVNDAPVAVADSIIVAEGGTATILVGGASSVLANDSDAENDTLHAILVSGPANGSLTLNNDGTFSYTHNGSETTGDSFTYKVNDGSVDGNTVTVNIGVTPVNDAPIAVNDVNGMVYSVNLGDASASDLWTTLDSKGFSVAVNAYKANGTAGTLYIATVDGNPNVLGVSDHARTNPTTTNEAPLQIEYDQDTGKSEAIELLFKGNLTSATFGVSHLLPGEHGGELGFWSAYYQGTLVASDSFRITSGSSSAANFTIDTGGRAFDSVKFMSLNTIDGTGDGGDYFLTGFSGTGTAAVNTAYTLAEGGTLSINAASTSRLLSNDTDADGDSLILTQINGSNINDGQAVSLASGASLVIHTDGSFNYSAGNAYNSLASGQVGHDSFSYTVSDGHGGTATATATMTIIGKNLTGTSGADTLVGGNYAEVIMGGPGNDTMTGGLGADTFKWTLNDQGSKGSPAVDTITDFNLSQGDSLHLSDLLQGENSTNLSHYLHFTYDGVSHTTTVAISNTGGFDGTAGAYTSNANQTIVLNGVNLTTLGTGSDSDIISHLKLSGNLITD